MFPSKTTGRKESRITTRDLAEDCANVSAVQESPSASMEDRVMAAIAKMGEGLERRIASSEEKCMAATTSSFGRGRGYSSSGRGHLRGRGRGKCYRCGQDGHFRINCPENEQGSSRQAEARS
jgi:hypothetical protein